MRTVFFDLDDTVLKGNSANLFIKYLLKRGELGWFDVLRGLYYTVRYKLNMIDIEEVSKSFLARYAGVAEQALADQCDEWFDQYVRPVIYEDALALIDEHRRQGNKLVLLTASTVYACRPVCRHLAFDGYVGTRLAVSDGLLTGEVEPPMCYGRGKLDRAREFLLAAGAETLADTTFYTDSITDLPMLEAVGDPQVVNPDPLLAREAKRRGWPVRYFKR